MKGALVTFIAKVEGVVKEKFSGALPQTPTYFAPPPLKIPGGATDYYQSVPVAKNSAIALYRLATYTNLLVLVHCWHRA